MQVATLKQNKASIKVLFKYLDFIDVFLKKETLVLSEQIEFNKYAIKLEGNKQLSYRPISRFGPIELETLKVYIKTYLKTGFISFFKFLANALILFDKKPASNF